MFNLGLWDKIRPREHINRAIRPFDVQLIPTRSLTYAQRMGFRPAHAGKEPDPSIVDHLRTTRHVLDELRVRYAPFAEIVGSSPLWKKNTISDRDLLFFRGDNAYVWQHRANNNPENYLLTYFYLKELDRLKLFDILIEDGAFGAYSFPVGETRRDGSEIAVSRDLLDSIGEIYFLIDNLDIFERKAVSVIDIGAGYGRLAHRMVTGGINLKKYLCTDAIAESTYLCDFYLSYRDVSSTASSIPFDKQSALSKDDRIDLAINIHSFSECSRKAIKYWMRRCVEMKIPYLFIVPNDSENGTKELCLHLGGTFNDIIEDHGYQLSAYRPKYLNPEVQKYGVSSSTYFIFKHDQFAREMRD